MNEEPGLTLEATGVGKRLSFHAGKTKILHPRLHTGIKNALGVQNDSGVVWGDDGRDFHSVRPPFVPPQAGEGRWWPSE